MQKPAQALDGEFKLLVGNPYATEEAIPVNYIELKDFQNLPFINSSDPVTAEKLADGAVTKYKIAEGAVSSSRLANNAVTKDKIENGAVTEDKLSQSYFTAVQSEGLLASLDEEHNSRVNMEGFLNEKLDEEITTRQSEIEDVRRIQIEDYQALHGMASDVRDEAAQAQTTADKITEQLDW